MDGFGWVRGWRRGALCVLAPLVMAACSSSSSGGAAGGVGSGTVDDTGGDVGTTDGRVTLSVPAGALPVGTSVDVTIREVSGASPSADLAAFAGASPVVAYDLSPDGTAFTQPVTVTIRLPQSAGAGGAITLPLLAAGNVSSGGVTTPLSNMVVTTDPATGEVVITGEITHFSQVQVVTPDVGGVTVKAPPERKALGAGFQVGVSVRLDEAFTNPVEVGYTDASTGAIAVVPPVAAFVEGMDGQGHRQWLLDVDYQCGTTPGIGRYRATMNVAPAGGATWEIGGNAVADLFPIALEVPVGDPAGGVPVSCEAPVVSFTELAQASAGESGTLTATVVIDPPPAVDVPVPFTLGGDAVVDTDYTVTATPLVIPAGAGSADIVITIIDDALVEQNESVSLSLEPPTAGGALLGTQTTHTATITDDDAPPTVSFGDSALASVAESGSLVTTVQLSSAAAVDVTVNFTVGGSATPGVDFNITNSPIVLPAGTTTADLTIDILPDTVPEPDEEVVVIMGAATGAVPGGITTFTGTITDDDQAAGLPEVRFASAVSSVGEAVGTVAMDVLLVVPGTTTAQPAPAGGVSVPFTAPVSSATPGVDYTLSATPLVIPEGQTGGQIVATIIDDTLVEGTESATINLGTPTNGTLNLSLSSHRIDITDNDAPPSAPRVSDAELDPQTADPLDIGGRASDLLGGTAGILSQVAFLVDEAFALQDMGAPCPTASETQVDPTGEPLLVDVVVDYAAGSTDPCTTVPPLARWGGFALRWNSDLSPPTSPGFLNGDVSEVEDTAGVRTAGETRVDLDITRQVSLPYESWRVRGSLLRSEHVTVTSPAPGAATVYGTVAELDLVFLPNPDPVVLNGTASLDLAQAGLAPNGDLFVDDILCQDVGGTPVCPIDDPSAALVHLTFSDLTFSSTYCGGTSPQFGHIDVTGAGNTVTYYFTGSGNCGWAMQGLPGPEVDLGLILEAVPWPPIPGGGNGTIVAPDLTTFTLADIGRYAASGLRAVTRQPLGVVDDILAARAINDAGTGGPSFYYWAYTFNSENTVDVTWAVSGLGPTVSGGADIWGREILKYFDTDVLDPPLGSALSTYAGSLNADVKMVAAQPAGGPYTSTLVRYGGPSLGVNRSMPSSPFASFGSSWAEATSTGTLAAGGTMELELGEGWLLFLGAASPSGLSVDGPGYFGVYTADLAPGTALPTDIDDVWLRAGGFTGVLPGVNPIGQQNMVRVLYQSLFIDPAGSCGMYPISGTITLMDGLAQSVSLTFDGADCPAHMADVTDTDGATTRQTVELNIPAKLGEIFPAAP